MATRSLIGLVLKDNSIKYSYCHNDGYLSGVGKTLLKHYKDFDKIDELLNYGDMSSLGKDIKRPKYSRKDNSTSFFDPDGAIVKITDLESYNFGLQSDAEYIYLFKDNDWYVLTSENRDFISLKEAIKLENSEQEG